MTIRHAAIASITTLVLIAPLAGQQAPPAPAAGRGNATAPPPIIWPSPPIPDGPISLETGLVRPIKITVTKGLNQPWSMAFLPDGSILVTERGGKLRMVRNGILDPTPIAGLPPIQAQGLAGLMDIQLHPRFATNNLIYFTYHKPQAPASGSAQAAAPAPPAGGRGNAAPPGVITLARARWDGSKLMDVKDLFSAIASGNASRIIFGRDGMIYMSVGYGDPPVGNPDPMHMPPQDGMNLAGKTLRLKDDGTVPPDNPFVGRAGARPEIFTYGHRNGYGLAFNPATGELWQAEIGPLGGDEVNILLPGHNYGWPLVSMGRNYTGTLVSDKPWYREGMDNPRMFWVPSISPSSLIFYNGDRFKGWKGSMFVGGLTNRTLLRMSFGQPSQAERREPLLTSLGIRPRDVREGPDGNFYVATEGASGGTAADGMVLKIEPVQ